jgi:GTPase SAR1 family protein
MTTEQNLPLTPTYVRFRVLIIGRANAGKTSILQRVCDTTESPEIHSVDPSGDRNPVRTRS